MKLLLHTCCAPCSIECIDALKAENIEITAFWYNPNIHPYKEYQARKNGLEGYAKSIGLPLVVQDNYGLREFITKLNDDFEHRCSTCYEMRFNETAKYASQNNFDAFCSSLFISPYQNYELMKEYAQKAADKYGIAFYEYDFRPLFRKGQARARELEIYMQKYCGCVFSEEERYLKEKVSIR